MEARKLAVQLAAVCPFALVLGMGVTFRHQTSAHPTLQYTEIQNQRIEAYSPLMLRDVPTVSSPKSVKRDVDTWIREAKLEKLQPLTPSFQEDLEGENPRAQIIQTWSCMMQRLSALTRRDVYQHHGSAAIEDATRTIEFGEILKYSDFDTLRLANSCSAKVLSLISPIIKNDSNIDISSLRLALTDFDRNRGKLPKLYKLLRSNYDDFVYRQVGNAHTNGDDATKSPDTSLEGLSALQLQRSYVIGVRNETELRSAGRRLFAGSSSAKS